MGRLSLRVYERIEQEGIKMKPAGYFRFCSFLWILLSGIFLSFASIVLSLIFNYFFNLKFWKSLASDPSDAIVSVFPFSPYLLILFFVFLIYFSLKSWTKSRLVIKHESWEVLSILLLISFTFSILLISRSSIAVLYDKVRIGTYIKSILRAAP